MKKALVALALLITPLSAQSAGLDIALSNSTANIAVLLNPYNFRAGGGSELALGAFTNEVGDTLLYTTLMAQGVRKLPNQQYNLGAGFKLVGGDLEVNNEDDTDQQSEKVGAVALGFSAGYVIPSRQNPMEVSVEGFFAPEITSFSNAESYFEFSAQFQVEIIPQALTYVGYRRITFNTENFSEVRLDQGLHLGIKLTF